MKQLYKFLGILLCGAGLAIAQSSQQSGSSAGQDPQVQNPVNPSNSSPGSGANGGVGQTAQTDSNPADVESRIQKDIQQDSTLAGGNISVSVNNGKVELTGTVASEQQKKSAGDVAQNDAAGMKVINHLKVSGNSPSPSPQN